MPSLGEKQIGMLDDEFCHTPGERTEGAIIQTGRFPENERSAA
jgi:hypothetical protein